MIILKRFNDNSQKIQFRFSKDSIDSKGSVMTLKKFNDETLRRFSDDFLVEW